MINIKKMNKEYLEYVKDIIGDKPYFIFVTTSDDTRIMSNIFEHKYLKKVASQFIESIRDWIKMDKEYHD